MEPTFTATVNKIKGVKWYTVTTNNVNMGNGFISHASRRNGHHRQASGTAQTAKNLHSLKEKGKEKFNVILFV